MENELISNQEFKEALENGQMSLSIAVYVEFMNKVFKKQSYLTNEAFKIFQEYYKICSDLAISDLTRLNRLQRMIVENFNSLKSQSLDILSPISLNNDEDGGTKLVLGNPNGFISVFLVVASTILFGIGIAYLFISKIK
ncbi:MAG TPA: hypothetical protein OIM63_05840 [Bacilli bacterium]|nr:hypothetical protein [Bacilli bacterium]